MLGMFRLQVCELAKALVVLPVRHEGLVLDVVRAIRPLKFLTEGPDACMDRAGMGNGGFLRLARHVGYPGRVRKLRRVWYRSMTARIIDGRALAAEIQRHVAQRAEALRSARRSARLDAVLISADQDSAARVYAMNQARRCQDLGIEYQLHTLPASSGYEDIAGRVLLLSSEPKVQAIMVHLPLPEGVDAYRIQSLIDPDKDVEGVNPANIGNIVYGRSSLAPCTALAVVRMIGTTGMDLRGKRVICVGASDIVGKPIAVMMMRPEATVISCNKYTEGIVELARSADVLVAAAGVPRLIKRDWVKPGAIVIDVGINRLSDGAGHSKTVGDVDFEEVTDVAGWVSPVPGGVGPVTVAVLLENVLDACERQ